MKLAIFFVFAACAFLAQAEASTFDGSLDRGALVDAVKTKLTQAKEKFDELLNKAQDTLKEKIAELRKQTEILVDQIQDKVGEIGEDMYEAAQKILSKVGEYEDKVAEQVKALKEKYGKK